MTYLVSVDPGVATGITLGYYDQVVPWERLGVWIVKGGLGGFLHWYHAEAPDHAYCAQWVSESFILRAQKFVANTEPLRIEGAMIALGLNPTFQDRTQKALCKDSVLKAHDLWVTGKMVGHTDGRDANDSTIHALAYMKKLKHEPTLKRYWAPLEKEEAA